MPPEIAKGLELPESCRLSAVADGSRQAETLSCGFGTPLLEKLIEVGRAEPSAARASLAVDSPRLAQARSLGERFAPRNGLAEVLGGA